MELIQFLDGRVELASEKNKVKAVLAKEKLLSDFEKNYGYEKEVITEVSKLPPHYIVLPAHAKNNDYLYVSDRGQDA